MARPVLTPLDGDGIIDTDWSYYGFIAEEVAELDARLVEWTRGTRDEDTEEPFAEDIGVPENVHYDRIVPHLVSLVQRQQKQIERQQKQIDDLTERLEALEQAAT